MWRTASMALGMKSDWTAGEGGKLIRRALLLIALLLVIAIGCLAGLIAIESLEVPDAEADAAAEKGATAAIAIDPPRTIADVALVDQHGAEARLSDFRGSLALLTFGYTHCPDVCPLTLNEFRRVREKMGELREGARFVFVSVDGARDRPDRLRRYFELRRLDGIVALTGAEAAVRQLGADLGVAFERTAVEADGGYLVNHTTGAFLLDREGRWIKRYPYGIAPSAIASDIAKLLS